MKPTFFESPARFRQWLEKNHDKAPELLVGFFKKDSGRPSITWPESVDQALCFGWIDGVRRRIDDVSYTIRFTPRRRGSIWSKINIGRATELAKCGLMHAAGAKAFEQRSESSVRQDTANLVRAPQKRDSGQTRKHGSSSSTNRPPIVAWRSTGS